MFQPFDGALFATGTVLSTGFALGIGTQPVLAAVAGATVTGVFVLAAKVVELWWKGRTDNRVRELERQLLEAKAGRQ